MFKYYGWRLAIEPSIEDQITATIPKGAFLREKEGIPGETGSLLVMYIELGYIVDPENTSKIPYESCDGVANGRAIEGKYHLAIYNQGTVIDDLLIPAGKDNPRGMLRLPFQNTLRNLG